MKKTESCKPIPKYLILSCELIDDIFALIEEKFPNFGMCLESFLMYPYYLHNVNKKGNKTSDLENQK